MFSYNFITIYSDVSNQQVYTAALFRKHIQKDLIIEDFTQASFYTLCPDIHFMSKDVSYIEESKNGEHIEYVTVE